MKNEVYLSDYLIRIDGSFSPHYSASHKDSFLYLADYIGIVTNHEFSYVHYSMVANPINETAIPEPITNEQRAKLDKLILCDPLVLDILCTICRFEAFDCVGLELKKIATDLKGHLSDQLVKAEQVAKAVLNIDLNPATEQSIDFSPAESAWHLKSFESSSMNNQAP